MKTFTQRLSQSSFTVLLMVAFISSPLSLSWAQEADAPAASPLEDQNALQLVTGDLQSFPVKNLTRISVTDPTVADIADAVADKVTIVGKRPGQTIVFLWDDGGKRSISVSVVTEDLTLLKEKIQDTADKAGIKGLILDVSAEQGKVIASGALPKKDKLTLDRIIEAYPDGVMNLTKEEVSEDLVQIDMQIVELSTSVTKNIGIDWGLSGDQTDSTGGVANNPLQLNYLETKPSLDGSKDWFKLGQFNRQDAINAQVNMLIDEGKGRLLSKPRLVVVSGKEASFLVGGEVPITSITTSNSGSSSTQNTTFKQYGVNLTVTPTIREGKVDVLLNVQVSDIDTSLKQFNDLAFITRTAQTNLFLDNGQTIVMAGLIKHRDGEDLKRVPFLSSIPIVGALFRNRSTPTPNADTEMVIILTPSILRDKKYAEVQTVMPTPAVRDFSKEIEAKYEHEPLNTTLPIAATQGIVVGNPQGTTMNVNSAVPAAAKDAIPTPPQAQVAPIAPVATVADPTVGTMPYARSIQEKISGAISYPYEALQNNWQGTVKLKLHILKDGTLATADVLESSGHDVFDQDALNTSKIVAPYPAFSGDMAQEDLIVTVPIVYSQGVLTKAENKQATAAN